MLKRHSRLNKFLLLAALAVLAVSCGKEKPKTGYVARVNEQYLTAAELAALTDSSAADGAAREEAVKRWIDREVLYQYARKKGLLDDPAFQALKKDQEKQLAAAWLLGKEEFIKIELPESRLKEFYEAHSQELRAPEDSFVFDLAVFNTEEHAVSFRQHLAETDWDRALALAAKQFPPLSSSRGAYFRASSVYSGNVLRVLNQLYPGEAGPVVQSEDAKFAVVKLVRKIAAGEVPPFELVKNDVGTLLKETERKRMLFEKLNELYSDNEIEIR